MTVDTTAREHLVTVVCGLWLTAGLFLDGYAHQHLETETESFVTPWHGVFYAGFTASVLWLWILARRRATGGSFLRALPAGYRSAAVGVALFAAGGAGDAVWHTAFGVERGIDALLSPTHLLLFTGLVLLLTAPFRAARMAGSSPGPWIVVASVTCATALVGFFLNFSWGLGTAAYTRVAYDSITEAGEDQLIAAVASMLVTTAVLFGAARYLLSRGGRVPTGAFTVMFGVVVLLVAVAFDEDAEGIAAAVMAGATLDVCMRTLPAAWGSKAIAAAFAAAAAVLWLSYLLLLDGLEGIDWQAEQWLGAIVLNGLAAHALASLPSLTLATKERP
jgi:hypothetical protein